MKRGFLTGLAAVLLLLVTASYFALEQSRTATQGTELVLQEGLQVYERFQQGQTFSSQTQIDALLDAAAAAHGCNPTGTVCSQLPTRLNPYLASSSGLLSQEGLLVNFTAVTLFCDGNLAAPAGFDTEYAVTTNLTGNVTLPQAKKIASLVQTFLVDVNSSLRQIRVRSPALERDVTLTCP